MHFIISVADSRSFLVFVGCLLHTFVLKRLIPMQLNYFKGDVLTFKSITDFDCTFSFGIILSGMFDQ